MEKLLFLVVIFIALGLGKGQKMYNVVDYSAKGDGETDDSKAFMAAWEATCADSNAPILQIPAGNTFLLQPIAFEGPCKSPKVEFQINGGIVAPRSLETWPSRPADEWILFERVSGLTVVGSGKIDGQGASWWAKFKSDSDRPTAIRFSKCDKLTINGLNSVDSPKNHISINNCHGVSVSNINLVAPKHSPNTDGIDISDSTTIHITDAFIGTGDDCVAINSGCNGINITHMNCGPGHGISVGSLGADGKKASVENIFVRNCIFNGTQNGARIKTWKGGSGYAKNIHYEQITLISSRNPIIIDQNYCDTKNCPSGSSAVAISDVKFIGFAGTSADERAITLNCSKTTNCNGIVLDKIEIKSAKPGEQVKAVSENAHGRSGSVVPKVDLLP